MAADTDIALDGLRWEICPDFGNDCQIAGISSADIYLNGAAWGMLAARRHGRGKIAAFALQPRVAAPRYGHPVPMCCRFRHLPAAGCRRKPVAGRFVGQPPHSCRRSGAIRKIPLRPTAHPTPDHPRPRPRPLPGTAARTSYRLGKPVGIPRERRLPLCAARVLAAPVVCF